MMLPVRLIIDIRSVPEAIFAIAFLTWPGSMMAQVMLGNAPRGRDRVLPQIWLVQRVAPLVMSLIPAWLSAAREHFTFSRTMRRIRRYLFSVLIVSALLIALSMDLPGLQGDRESEVRAWICSGILGAAWLITKFRRLLETGVERRRLDELLVEGSLTGDELLARLHKMSSSNAVGRLIDGLAQAPHEMVRPAATVLSDLAIALDIVTRLVPAETTTRIPPEVWDYAPRFHNPGFSAWLKQYDKEHPGRLAWLAADYYDKVARAAKSAATRSA
jgi:hypothetical protein